MGKWSARREDVVNILARYDISEDASEAFKAIQEELLVRRWHERPLESLPWEVRVFFLVWEAEGQINCGGMGQFFYCGYGKQAEDTVQALMEIGAVRKASALAVAMASFPGARYPRTGKEYEDILHSAGGDVALLPDILDDLYVHKSEDVEYLVVEFVKTYFDSFAP